MAVEEGGPNSQEVGVARVVNLNHTPRVLASADLAATDLDNVLGADNGERHEASQLGVLLDGVLVVFLDIVGEVVDRDAVVLNVLHDELLRLGQLGRGQGIGATDDRNDVDTGSKALHQLNIQLAETAHHELDKTETSVCGGTYPWPVGVMK